MSNTVNKGDFIEIEYDGRLKEPEMLFDTTSEENARKEGIFRENVGYGPIVVCAGETQLLQGLDQALVGKQVGEHEIALSAEQAFGKKRYDLLKIVPLSSFKKHGIQAAPGLQVNVDGAVGVIKTVNSGRCIVDFNHPFAGKKVVYNVKIKRKVEDKVEKVKGFLMLALNVKKESIAVKDNTIKVDRELPKELVDHVKQKMERVLPEYKGVNIVVKELKSL
ncbi:MAG: peptidylprolyl isomerase [Candidatus Nanoarchaeia archaeon]